MIIETSRFGQIEIDEQRLIEFPSGILGFPNSTHFALVQAGEGSGFYWLQAVDRPDLAFVVCDPRLFVSDYTVPIRSDELTELGVKDSKDAQVFIIVNKVEDLLMGNLQGPLVVGVETRRGRQLVLTDRRYSTRHPLMRVPGRETLSKTG